MPSLLWPGRYALPPTFRSGRPSHRVHALPLSGRGPPQGPLHRPTGAAELGRDGADGPAGSPELGCLESPIGDRHRFRLSEADGDRDDIAVVGTKPAVPATAHVRVLGPEREGQAGQACLAAGTAGESKVARPPTVGMVRVGIHSAACGVTELTAERLEVGVVDQRAKLGLAVGKEISGTHGYSAPALGRCSGHRWTRVSWVGSRRPRLVPPRPWPGVAQAAADVAFALRCTGP